MLLPIMPGKKFDTIIGTFVFHHMSHNLLRMIVVRSSRSCVPMYYSKWIILYIQTLVQSQTAVVKITCLTICSAIMHIYRTYLYV